MVLFIFISLLAKLSDKTRTYFFVVSETLVGTKIYFIEKLHFLSLVSGNSDEKEVLFIIDEMNNDV